ncbi:hypothetical protein C8F01DRAFT_753242 [Mycena amicta]|nr:hypothetical protein C8F01DRAFT_753242 [Mycena amicta]
MTGQESCSKATVCVCVSQALNIDRIAYPGASSSPSSSPQTLGLCVSHFPGLGISSRLATTPSGRRRRCHVNASTWSRRWRHLRPARPENVSNRLRGPGIALRSFLPTHTHARSPACLSTVRIATAFCPSTPLGNTILHHLCHPPQPSSAGPKPHSLFPNLGPRSSRAAAGTAGGDAGTYHHHISGGNQP